MAPLAAPILSAVLDAMPVARLALRDFDDTPQALPIVFARAAGALWMPIDGKPKRSGATLGRLARLARAPRVTLLLDHYAPDWSTLWWIRLRCETDIRRDPGHPDWAAAVAALARKYPQYATVPMFRDDAILVRYAWTEVASWAATPTAITRWLQDVAPL